MIVNTIVTSQVIVNTYEVKNNDSVMGHWLPAVEGFRSPYLAGEGSVPDFTLSPMYSSFAQTLIIYDQNQLHLTSFASNQIIIMAVHSLPPPGACNQTTEAAARDF